MHDGQSRAVIMTGGRVIENLHLCHDCAATAMRAWPSVDTRQGVRIVLTPWRGPCDLCRFLAAHLSSAT